MLISEIEPTQRHEAWTALAGTTPAAAVNPNEGLNGAENSHAVDGILPALNGNIPDNNGSNGRVKESVLTPDRQRLREELDNLRHKQIAAAAINGKRVELDRREDAVLFGRLKDGDLVARQQLVEKYLPLAYSIARKYAHSSEPIEDLVQVASLGLLKAIKGFDLDQQNAFSTYAVPTISGEIKRYFRDRTWGVHVPRDLQELTSKIKNMKDRLAQGQQSRDSEPTIRKIAEELGVNEEEVLEGLLVIKANARWPDSLSKPLATDGDDIGELGDLIVDEGAAEEFVLIDDQSTLDAAIATLPERLRKVVEDRLNGHTQAEIGNTIGVSQMQVSRMLKQAIRMLYSHVNPEPR